MTVVCNSWSLALEEQGNSLSFLFLCSECSLCSLHTDIHTLLTASLSSKQTLRQPLSVREPTISPLSEQRRGGMGKREEGGHILMGGSGFKPPCWQTSALLKCSWTGWWIHTSSSGVVLLWLTLTSDLISWLFKSYRGRNGKISGEVLWLHYFFNKGRAPCQLSPRGYLYLYRCTGQVQITDLLKKKNLLLISQIDIIIFS